MKAKALEHGGLRTWLLAFETGDEALSELRRFAEEKQLDSSHFSAIGAFRRVVLGYFDWSSKDYRENPVDEQVEVANLTGFITAGEDGPKIHAHVTLGRSDGAALAGHLLRGEVRPTLELVIEESPSHLRRRLDPDSGLPLIAPDA